MCRVQDGSGGDEFGRSSAARRRVNRQRSPSLQAQGSDGKHHWRSEAPLLLSEAGRKAPGEASFGAKALLERRFAESRTRLQPSGPLLPSSGFLFRRTIFFRDQMYLSAGGSASDRGQSGFAKIAKYKNSRSANPLSTLLTAYNAPQISLPTTTVPPARFTRLRSGKPSEIGTNDSPWPTL